MSTWPTEDLAAIANSEELQVITQRADRTPARPVTIWVVRVDDDLYVRSAYGPQNPWFRRAIAQGNGRIHAGGLDRDVSFEPASPALEPLISAAYRRKYHRYPPDILDPMVSSAAAAATLRLRPRPTA